MHIHGGNIYKQEVKADFSANLNLLGMPKKVEEAAIEGVRASIHYPDPENKRLREKLGEFHGINQDWIVCGNGAAELIFAFAQTVKPQKALVLAPSFYEYEQALKSVHCKLKVYPLKKDHEFILDQEILEEDFNGLDALFLCNPNNPTSQLIESKLLEEIIQKCEKTQTFCVLDECFLPFVECGEERSGIKLLQNPYLIILRAFTKTYAMPGIRLGYLISSNIQLLEQMKEGLQPWNVSVVAQYAGAAALELEGFLEDTRKELGIQKIFITDLLQECNYKILGKDGNFIFFYGEDDLAKILLEDGIMIRDCSNFRGLSQGYYRIAVRNKEENQLLAQALRRKNHG